MADEPKRPALLIIDMQNDFANPQTRLYSEKARSLIPLLNQLTAACRSNNVPVIWVIQEHRHQLVDFGREGDISPVHCVEGTFGVELIEDLEQAESDYTVIKRRYSGFYATDLDLLLRCLDCNTVILTGIATDGCVQATGLDAQARDYYVRAVVDATAGTSEEATAAALGALGRMQPDVMISGEEALALITGG
jgi:nicotinamidase-related amidase